MPWFFSHVMCKSLAFSDFIKEIVSKETVYYVTALTEEY